MAFRPIKGDVTEALLHYYEIDAQSTEPAIHKEEVYSKIKQYYIHNPDKNRNIAWALTAQDPVKEIIKRHVPTQLHDMITARKAVGTNKRENKVRAFRYLRDKQNKSETCHRHVERKVEITSSSRACPNKKPKTSHDTRGIEQTRIPRLLEQTTAKESNTGHTERNQSPPKKPTKI